MSCVSSENQGDGVWNFKIVWLMGQITAMACKRMYNFFQLESGIKDAKLSSEYHQKPRH